MPQVVKKPVIVVSALFDRTQNNYWMRPGYMCGITKAGGIPLMLPLDIKSADIEQIFQHIDGLLLTGGDDLNPLEYGQQPKTFCGSPCLMRDKTERSLFELAVVYEKPILGICRGLQLMNVCAGGTLFQDIPSETPSKIQHHQSEDYSVLTHSITSCHPLFERIVGTHQLEVNSRHHQAINRLGTNVEILATADDGIVESIRLASHKWAIAVQWHPECLYEQYPEHLAFFNAFVNACR